MTIYATTANEIIAKTIAEKANECCYRSDGYEELIYRFALELIEKRIDEVVDLWSYR